MKLGYLVASLNLVDAQKSPIVGEWEEWSQCDAPCGVGERRRERRCLITNFRRCNKQPGGLVEVEDCNTEECTGDPYWSNWSEKNKCSETCGGGTQSRFRYCIGGEAGDVGCEGISEEVTPCATELCPGDLCKDSFFDVAILIEANTAALSYNSQIKSFLKNLVGSYKAISSNDARLCLMRFSSWPEILNTFDEIESYGDAVEIIDSIPFYGKDADLAAALFALQDECFDLSTGWRGTELNNNGVASQTIIITSSNSTINQIDTIRLKKKSQRIFAITLGDSSIENVELLVSDPVEENYFEGAFLDDVLAEAIVQRQCSNELFPDQCYSNSGRGSCDGECFTQYNGVRCTCPKGTFLLEDGATCEDIDECATGTHDCLDHQTCSNSFGGFRCGTIMHDCPAGFPCSHGCGGGGGIGGALSIFEMEIGQSSPCTCPFGMVLGPDNLTCMDQIPIFLLDECKNNNGGCSHICRDLDDGFVCECPEELGLSDDGLTCVSICYTCENAADLTECQQTELCPSSTTPCVTKISSGKNGASLISKGCESTERCIKDGSDKPVNFWTSPKCEGDTCDCCCYDSFCNTGADCAAARSPFLACPERPQSDLFDVSCTGSFVGDVCSYKCEDGLSPNTPGLLSCSIDESTGEAVWMGEEPTACNDVNECLVGNGKCQQKCVNRPSGFKCECYDDYDPQRDAKYDLVFIVDRSDTTPVEYLDAYKDFMRTIVIDRPVGNDFVRVAILSYASDVKFEASLEEANSLDAILNVIDSLEISGVGRKTANAVEFLLDQVDRQGREHIPMVSILLTSGVSDEDRLKVILAGWRVQAATWCNAYSLGIGPYISEEEMFLLSGDLQHYQMISSPDLLSDVPNLPPLDEYLDIFFPGDYTLLADGISCNIDECASGLHGCSYQCQDFPNGYRCLCPPGAILGQDGKTCDADYCVTAGCEYGCVSRSGTFNCICPQGKQLSYDGKTCEDLDECRQFNGGCSHGCQNTNPSYKCTCPEGMVISQDMRTCKVNICLQKNCEQGCSPQDGECRCYPGYYLASDGRTCEKFNRCHLDNGGCEFNCVADANFDYHCECPEGLNLRPDRKTCGVACYSCSWAESEDECNQNGQITCPAGDNACQVELRRINGVQYISKGCKQPEACLSNYAQNWAERGNGITQCNQQEDSTCHYCCFSHLCNAGFDFSLEMYFLPMCPINFPLIDFEVFGGNENGVKIGGSVRQDCPDGTFSSSGSQAMCDWAFDQSTTQVSAFWSSKVSNDGQCEDVDECENSPCSQNCLNLYGNYRCYCQRDREQSCSKNNLAILFVMQGTSDGFAWFKDFAKQMIEPLIFPEARIGVISYGEESIVNVPLESGQTTNSVLSKLRGAPAISGTENNLGSAVDFAASYLNGRNLPGSYTRRIIILLDGKSTDEIISDRLKSEADSIFVIGTSNSSNKELQSLTENVVLMNDYIELSSIISDELLEGVCDGSSSYKSYGSICEKDECAENNGGCQHHCHNTHGSYHCSCTNGRVLASDGRNCVEDYCRNNNCSHQCENKVEGAQCICPESMKIGNDGRTCVDIDECEVNNGGCESVCVNTDPWYQCACPGALLAQNQRSCVPDPCEGVTCNVPDQICYGNHDGIYQCRCADGYRHNAFLGICEDIDECLYGNYCQYGCENLEGGYRCTCPEGKVLRDDGRTCGIVCYSSGCINAATNEECNRHSEVCTPEADSCQNEIRIHSGVKRITKRCKQGLACQNNYRQNPPSYLLDYYAQPQSQHQCNGGTANNVCRCCCQGNHCNWAEKPCTGRYDCGAADFDELVFLVDGSKNIKLHAFNEIAASIASISEHFEDSSVEISTVLFSANGTNLVEKLTEDVFNGDLNGSTQMSVDFINSDLTSNAKIVLITNSPGEVIIPDGFSAREIYVVGVGNVEHDTLSLIASGNVDNVYRLGTASELDQIVNDLESKVCRAPDFCELAECSHTCYSDAERAYCTCPDKLILDTDFKTCVSSTMSIGANLCSINNGGCQQRCIFDGPGHHCECEPGYRLDDNYRGCHDVNECMINNGDCSDRCINTPGAHQCICSNWAEEKLSGTVTLNFDDGRTCVPICDRGFSYYGHACWRIQGTFDFFDARESCSSVGAHLAILKDQNHLRAVVDHIKSWEEENESLVGAKYWVGLFRSSDRIPFIPPGNWTWITGLNDESFQNLQLDLDDALNNTDGDWANAVFQNFIWGSEDPIKVQLDCMEHIKHTKAYRPTYTAEDNVLAASIDQVYDKFGGRRNYIDDRYPSRSRRDLTYGNPCGAPRTACGSAYSYNGKATLSAEPCWKPLNYICQKTLSESFLQYQNVWDSGAIVNLYMSSDSNQVTLTFPVPVKLNVWHGFSSESNFATTHVLTQRVNGNHYEKHSGKGILSFAMKLATDSILNLADILIN